MSIATTIRSLCLCAGLIAGTLVWAIETQLGQVLPDVECCSQIHWLAVTSFVAAAVAGLGGLLSWRTAIRTSRPANNSTFRFLGSVSGLAALIFAFAVAMQGMASLVLSGCER